MSEFLTMIERLVSDAVAEGTDKDPFLNVMAALESCPVLNSIEGLEFRHGEYEVEVIANMWVEKQVEALAYAKALGLSSAPELAARIPAGEGSTVLVRRYPVPPGERILDFDKAGILPPPDAQEQLRKDMQTLAAHGATHPYARGTFHWLISSGSGRLFLNSWEALRTCSEVEAEQICARVETHLQRINEEHARNRIRQVFGVSRVLLPVVHPVSWEEALQSVQVAVTAGVRGIFLINQGLSATEVLRLVLEVRKRHPRLWVGLNLLGYSPAAALEAALAGCEGRIDGIWSDNAGIEEDAKEQKRAQEFVEVRQRHGWQGLFFGGVAFKYQREVAPEKLPVATRLAANYMDVICTSGPGTGQQADPAKVATMRGAVGHGAAISLASGVTADNVHHYLPYVNAYLVGTGIEHAFGVLDPVKTAALQAAIASYGSGAQPMQPSSDAR